MNTYYRPVLHIEKSNSERVANIIGYASLVAMVLYLLLKWSSLPAQVAAHFNAAGEVDRWGSKYELLILPVIAILITFFMELIERYPHVHNYPERLCEANVHAFYLNSRQMLNYMKNIINMLFAFLVYESIEISVSDDIALGLPFGLFLFALFVVMIWKIIVSTKIK
ncbi:hypothetical protein CSE16_07785 [Solibacillus sp. R5-41]|uniref:DUF1648 domain-containing protein n=1 Tax=Solibacillus sp. R5-41 TaxID=2048654 RepID=UPI000C129031|nr:DUF1648 domain-containing protein [Solibacillus sp. R5-41]ATP39958.1 hypothetical protein CSE16_07785 [Solibacillus sp. R5-41]